MSILEWDTHCIEKSYLSSLAVSSAQKEGGEAMWVDVERSYDKDWMTKCGIDQSKILVAQLVILSSSSKQFEFSTMLTNSTL